MSTKPSGIAGAAALALGLFALCDPAAARKLKEEDLSNMVIEGENRLKVPARVPEMEWKVDLDQQVAELMRAPALVAQLAAPALADPPLDLPQRSASKKTASPWHCRIYDPPILTLENKSAGSPELEWLFLVKDSRGKTFYEERKRGTLPRQLAWDGFGDGGAPLQVGFDYTYSLSVIDEAGNHQRFAGQAFNLDSFRHGKVTSFAPEALFQSRSSVHFSGQGIDLLTEVKDHLRTRYGKKVEVVTYGDDIKFGLSRSLAIKQHLSQSLDLPEENVKANALPNAQGGAYSHVDIIVR